MRDKKQNQRKQKDENSSIVQTKQNKFKIYKDKKVEEKSSKRVNYKIEKNSHFVTNQEKSLFRWTVSKTISIKQIINQKKTE